ncbi:hypothetical protein [Gorillibacterium sp. sgz5001074]|uniref:hypothetical protein n=1 Tax=Gorillibacterium sp. sgz5001074 TaxID=3446695 RepID=UPI003F66DBFF
MSVRPKSKTRSKERPKLILKGTYYEDNGVLIPMDPLKDEAIRKAIALAVAQMITGQPHRLADE